MKVLDIRGGRVVVVELETESQRPTMRETFGCFLDNLKGLWRDGKE